MLRYSETFTEPGRVGPVAPQQRDRPDTGRLL
jgi:hypothetical protein